MHVIETKELRKTFKSRQGKDKIVTAVKGVDMAVTQGEIFGFLGPNGAGKTTTLRMLSTLLQPDGGSAMVAGHDLLREPARVRERIGYVGQAGGMDRSLTAREDLILQARLYNMDKSTARERAARLIDALELSSFADRKASTYSGGQQRRLDLALGMVHQPVLLFLDEPTTGLDPQSRARLWDEVRRLREDGTTIFITTHYLDEADALCDRLAIIDNGEIVVEGSPDALKRQIAGDIITLGLISLNGSMEQANMLLGQQPFIREIHRHQGQFQLFVENGEEALPNILRLLDREGLSIQTISLARPSLDDVFLRQTGRSLREAAG